MYVMMSSNIAGNNLYKPKLSTSKKSVSKYNVSFGRTLTTPEVPLCKADIQKGLEALGKKLTIIMPDRCNPSLANENTGIGSYYSKGAKKFTKFLEKIGITGIQRDPGGNLRPSYVAGLNVKDNPQTGLSVDKFNYIRPFDPSPYISTESGNELNISLKDLTSGNFGTLISKKTLKNIVKNNPSKDTNKINFDYVNTQTQKALREAYNTFNEKVSQIDNLKGKEKKKIMSLNKKFETFKQTYSSELEKDSVYAALSKENKTDIWEFWNATDKNLYTDSSNLASAKRIAQIKEKQSDEINFYKFKQFLIKEQSIKKQHFDEKHGITSIADEKVATSDIGVWANQNLFLKDFSLGCPPDCFSKTGQAWGFPVLDPEKIINKDGQLGTAGKFLYDKYKKIFSENKGGVRIDHIIGLIDPFVYPKGKLPTDINAGRLYSSPNNPKLAQYSKNTVEQYSTILKKIVIPAAKEAGVSKNSIICEDLGTLTPPVVEVLKQLQMPGIRVSEFVNPKDTNDLFRGKNANPKDVIMPGSHDNGTLVEYVKDLRTN